MLDLLASFFKSLKTAEGRDIPIIFRPFHEANMTNCFWWNYYNNNCGHDNYKQLWKYTLNYLQQKQVHNLLYALSLNENCHGYIEHYDLSDDYPGDNYVDILRYDIYYTHQDIIDGDNSYTKEITYHSNYLLGFANTHQKVPAITEFGVQDFSRPNADIWTSIFDPLFSNKPFAFTLLWRNPDHINDFTHSYSVYPGNSSAENFRLFYKTTRRFIFQSQLTKQIKTNTAYQF